MHVWLQAIFLIASRKKGISANQLHRSLGISLKSAWFMGHRVREASIPFGRLGTPDEITKAVVFLSSDNSSFMTMGGPFVDGGVAQL